MVFLVECPRCHKQMKYQQSGSSKDLTGKVKRCVYCNFSIRVKDSVVQEI